MAEQTAEQIVKELDHICEQMGITPGDPLVMDINALFPRRFTDDDIERYLDYDATIQGKVESLKEAFDALTQEIEIAPSYLDR
ncbi:MAG: hypothetical protein AB7D37_11025 [Desulfovibrio sp.]